MHLFGIYFTLIFAISKSFLVCRFFFIDTNTQSNYLIKLILSFLLVAKMADEEMHSKEGLGCYLSMHDINLKEKNKLTKMFAMEILNYPIL